MKLGVKRGEIKLVDPQKGWKDEFQKIREEIYAATGIGFNYIEHIGSTSIVDIKAKPMIDFAVGVDDINKVSASTFEKFRKIGFHRLRVVLENEIVLARFTDDTFEIKTHIIHLIDYKGKKWNDFISFRNKLNSSKELRKEYESIKESFIKNESGDMNDYTNYKAEFIQNVLREVNIAHLKKQLSTIDEILFFDENQYLREKTSDPMKLKQLIGEAENLLLNCEGKDKVFLYGTLGNLYRINGQPKKAIHCLTYCVDFAEAKGNPTNEIIFCIRLGEAFKYDNCHKKALDLFNKALKLCDTHRIDEYMDFAYQHKGKCLMELGMPIEAKQCFEQALILRTVKGNTSLIDSTKQAIEFIRKNY
ncbi:MAG TPA: GrpB family protein [Candidatus Dormibacteraeota bacterium]|nr:GrpB family protein [Candidatus Dormibacteraeota bacterium]